MKSLKKRSIVRINYGAGLFIDLAGSPPPLSLKSIIFGIKMTGWIKLHRVSIEKGWLKNHSLWVFWTYCLLKASHERNVRRIGFQEVLLEPGQFIFGRRKAAEETGLGEQTIRTCIKSLKKSKNLTIKVTNKFSTITITNWASYQSTNQQLTSNLTSNQPATNQQLTTDKNEKNEKNEKKKTIEENPEHVESANKVIEYLNETVKPSSLFTLTKTNRSVITARLNEKPPRTVEQCKVIIDNMTCKWKGGEFEWCLNPETLFRKTKFERNLNATPRVGQKKGFAPPREKEIVWDD